MPGQGKAAPLFPAGRLTARIVYWPPPARNIAPFPPPPWAAQRQNGPVRRAQARLAAGQRAAPPAGVQMISPLRSMPCTPFSPFTVWVTRKSTASEQS